MTFSTVNAAGFAFENASNNYVINSDGSIRVTENMTINFYDTFKEGYREIPLGNIKISEIEVYSGSEKLNHRTKTISDGIEILVSPTRIESSADQ